MTAAACFDDEALLSRELRSGDDAPPGRPAKRRVFRASVRIGGLVALVAGTAAVWHAGRPSMQMKVRPAVQLDLQVGTCASQGANCSASRCCKSAGMQCYVKDMAWAECRPGCVPGPDPTGADSGPWNCTKLGKRAPGHPPVCSKAGEDCSSSRCCAETGMQCFEKMPGWASCKATCTKGVDLTDIDPKPWSCNPLGVRTPGPADWVAKVCASPGENCMEKACCAVPGQQCYGRDEWWGECATNCSAGSPCIAHGQRTPLAPLPPQASLAPIAPWVAEKCAAEGEDCSSAKCCQAAGNQCFQKNATFARCRGTCTPGVDLYDSDAKEWWCHPVGPRTPGVASTEPWKRGAEVADWVRKECSREASHDCRKTQCCRDTGRQCYEKDAAWATCMTTCTPGPREGDETGGNWTCNELGPRTRAPWGTPSLYCFSVVQPHNYEPGLLKAQMGTGAGIFACEEYSVFSTERITIGDGPSGPVETLTFIPAPVVQSKDYTAGNAELFMHVWNSVRSAGIWQETDWTIKVDPDAVLLPQRLRLHLKPHTGDSVYIVNCAKPYMPEGPMMFGAMEAISKHAISTYFSKAADCTGGLPWQAWGEDLFMGKCLEKLGVQRANDFHIYSDGVCTGVDCTDPDAAAFHPKKDVASWMACLEQTKHPVSRSSTPEPQWFKDYMKTYAR